MLSANSGKSICRLVVIALLLPWPFLGCGSRPEPAHTNLPTNLLGNENTVSNSSKPRISAVAGLFYPADPAVLSRTVDQLLARAPIRPLPHLRGLICPHAGYEFSGPTAAHGYQLVKGGDFHTVIVLGPSHYALFAGASVPDADTYRTPLGLVPISEKARQLVGQGPFVLEHLCQVERPEWWSAGTRPAPAPGNDTPETWEHSVEVQVPFLQRTLPHFKLLPVILGEVDPEQVAQVLAGQLDDSTLVIASSDLSHYYPYEMATNLDQHCIQAILHLDLEAMKSQEACGKLPILALMSLARRNGWTPQLLDAHNSGDVTGDRKRVVGYAAIAFYEPSKEAYTTSDREFLLNLARETLEHTATNGPLPSVNRQNLPPKLAATKACFVTLTEKGELRGCIGHIFPQEPLYQAVEDNAENAARRDPRFLPVQAAETSQIKIEISVLTEPKPLDFTSPEDLLTKLEPHADGVVLKIGSHSATYLPQVWEQIPDKTEFLNQLSEKAGCEPAAWRGRNTTVFIYHVEAFKESE
jgi:hypothetical protein